MPRPKKPTELKKLEGTYRADRERKNPSTDVVINKVDGVIFQEDVKIICPKSLKTKYVRKFYKTLTSNLIALKVLSAQDLPEIEHMCIVLEKLRDIDTKLIECDFIEDPINYDRLIKTQSILNKQFESIAGKYFISPVARQKMVLDNFNIQKTAQEIKKEDSAISSLLESRNLRRV